MEYGQGPEALGLGNENPRTSGRLPEESIADFQKRIRLWDRAWREQNWGVGEASRRAAAARNYEAQGGNGDMVYFGHTPYQQFLPGGGPNTATPAPKVNQQKLDAGKYEMTPAIMPGQAKPKKARNLGTGLPGAAPGISQPSFQPFMRNMYSVGGMF